MASMSESPNPKRMIGVLIGNDDYSLVFNKLRQSINNIRDIGKVLETFEFEVQLITNADCRKFQEVVKAIGENATDGDLIFFYYTGHSHQINGMDYLIPIDDVSFDSDENVIANAPSIQGILDLVSNSAKLQALVCILDCPRLYRLGGTHGSKDTSISKGIRRLKVPRDTIIQFSCDADQVLDDGKHDFRNTLYTKILLEHMNKERVLIQDIFQYMEKDVYQQSKHQQRPICVNRLPKTLALFFNYGLKQRPLRTEDFLSNVPISPEEKNYLDECKEYYKLTKEPLVCFSDEVLVPDISPPNFTLKVAIDESCHCFQLQEFLNSFCQRIDLPQELLVLKRIQKGSTIIEAEISDKLPKKSLKLKLKAIYHSVTGKIKEELANMKIFFLFMGAVESLGKIEKFRSEIRMNPTYNRTYVKGRDFWEGPTPDNLDRGGNPYFCPVGWRRWSFFVTQNFYEKFKGWSICYHGTKFSYGLGILLSGLKPAKRAQHGEGIYTTPSINYACHPRYAEIKRVQSSEKNRFFKDGEYVQFVLECRVHPSNILLKKYETLDASNTIIDDNIRNNVIEWLINSQGKDVVDFNDPNASIICSGIMVRVTDNHPGLLPQSQWWFYAHLCNYKACCALETDLDGLKRRRKRGDRCRIMYEHEVS